MQRTLIYYLSLFALKYYFSSAASDRLLNSCADELALIANRSSEKGKERTPVSLVADVFVACDLTVSGEWTKQQLLREVAVMLECEELVDESLMKIKMVSITIPKIFKTEKKSEERKNDYVNNNASEFTRACYFSTALDANRPIYTDSSRGVTYDHYESNQQQRCLHIQLRRKRKLNGRFGMVAHYWQRPVTGFARFIFVVLSNERIQN